MIRFTFVVVFFFTSLFGFAQSYHSELGVEVQAASFSNMGGTIGGALKWAFVEEESLAYGPSFRFQYLFSQNTYLGTSSSAFVFGGGGFLHYRFLEWFFLGTEVEVLKNPYRYVNPQKNWKLTAFLGGGISKDFDFVRLNVGILYDVADAISDPLTSNPSPLSGDYFFRVSDPNNPNLGKYMPIIYRIAFFFPLNRNKD
ncbi:hypothetical protein ERX46_05890 [Brumimicrobium glaciale]|uniref:Outer membrane protein beta-barrel domain-containing protein n=1 Tax=Brumimicrobium glaciale TaxID=200475 RepID=A0A4V1WFZ4_9FLAO|nr:hypothetical protein [Brumimicrobium glaciale]RYM34906.1 hypothetical protein ERX46_05890 [Brumimicrobium glaciale]